VPVPRGEHVCGWVIGHGVPPTPPRPVSCAVQAPPRAWTRPGSCRRLGSRPAPASTTSSARARSRPVRLRRRVVGVVGHPRLEARVVDTGRLWSAAPTARSWVRSASVTGRFCAPMRRWSWCWLPSSSWWASRGRGGVLGGRGGGRRGSGSAGCQPEHTDDTDSKQPEAHGPLCAAPGWRHLAPHTRWPPPGGSVVDGTDRPCGCGPRWPGAPAVLDLAEMPDAQRHHPRDGEDPDDHEAARLMLNCTMKSRSPGGVGLLGDEPRISTVPMNRARRPTGR